MDSTSQLLPKKKKLLLIITHQQFLKPRKKTHNPSASGESPKSASNCGVTLKDGSFSGISSPESSESISELRPASGNAGLEMEGS